MRSLDDLTPLINRASQLYHLILSAIEVNNTYEVFVLTDGRSKVIDELIQHGFTENSLGFKNMLEDTEHISEQIQKLIFTFEDRIRHEVQFANAKKAYGLEQSKITHY
jgi:predicted component of type VI protein secretion system